MKDSNVSPGRRADEESAPRVKIMTRLAWSADIRRSRKFRYSTKTVAEELAYVGQSGEYWLGAVGLTASLGIAKSTVIKALDELEAAKLITREKKRRADGYRAKDVITLVLESSDLRSENQTQDRDLRSDSRSSEVREVDISGPRIRPPLPTGSKQELQQGERERDSTPVNTALTPTDSNDGREAPSAEQLARRGAQWIHEQVIGSEPPSPADLKAMKYLVEQEKGDTELIKAVFWCARNHDYWGKRIVNAVMLKKCYAEVRPTALENAKTCKVCGATYTHDGEVGQTCSQTCHDADYDVNWIGRGNEAQSPCAAGCGRTPVALDGHGRCVRCNAESRRSATA